MPSNTCQKCRQPLRTTIEDSVAALTPSTYDLISSTLSAHPFIPSDLSRVPQSFRAGFGAISPRTHSRSNSTAPPSPSYPLDSFIVLSESVVGSARQATASGDDPQTTLEAAAPPALSTHLNQLASLHAILADSTGVDYPLCSECMIVLTNLMTRELDEAKKERERLTSFEKSVSSTRKETGVISKEVLAKDIAKFARAEQQATDTLKRLEAERLALAEEEKALQEAEDALEAEEKIFWEQYSSYLLEATSLQDRANALQAQYVHESIQLDKLQNANPYKDVFSIGAEGSIGTINKLRLGRTPECPVEWPEINAAWGQALLMLQTIARKCSFTFEGYRLLPMGSFSKIEKLSDKDKSIYELYGDYGVTSFLQNRRVKFAMIAFLDCLSQLMDFMKRTDRTIKFSSSIYKDKIGNFSIAASSEIEWSSALKLVLVLLKELMSHIPFD